MPHTGMEPQTLVLLTPRSDPLSPAQSHPLHARAVPAAQQREAEERCASTSHNPRCKEVISQRVWHPTPSAVCNPVLLLSPAVRCQGSGLWHSQPGCASPWTTAPSSHPAQTGAADLCWESSGTAPCHNSPTGPAMDHICW